MPRKPATIGQLERATLNHMEKFNLNLRVKLKRAISRKKVITQPFYPRPNSYP